MKLYKCRHLYFLLFVLQSCHAKDSCVFFKLDDQPVVIRNGIASVRFKVKSTCENNNNLLNVKVKLKKESPPNVLICNIGFLNSSCSEATGCHCDPGTQEYVVTRPVSELQRFHGNWQLSGELDNGDRIYRTLIVNTTYLPVILNFTVESQGVLIEHNEAVDENSEIKFTCVWSEGIPSKRALIKNNGLEIPASEAPFSADKRQYVYHSEHTIGQAKCSDSGEFSCEAPGSKGNRTVLLLVKCSPQFGDTAKGFPFDPSGTLLHFPVHVYSEEIVDCRLHKLDTLQGHTQTRECKRAARWSGQVPNLTLGVLLTNVTSDLMGTWRLELENRIGTGSVNFSIGGDSIRNNSPEITTEGTELANDMDGLAGVTVRFEFFVLLGAIGSVFLLVIILATVFAILFKRRTCREGSPLALPPPVSHGVRCRLPDSVSMGDILLAARDERPRDSFVSAHGHIYNEINDDVEHTTTNQSKTWLDTSLKSESFRSDQCLQTIAFSSFDSTVSEGFQLADSSGCDDSVHLGASPSSEGALSYHSGYSLARPLQDTSISDYLHPVASEFEVATPFGSAFSVQSCRTKDLETKCEL